MTNESLENIMQNTSFFSLGQRLRSARESLGIALAEAALQLRLNENILLMLEADTCPPHLPPMFIRGYTRAYAKLLQLPEEEVLASLVPLTTPAVPAPITDNFSTPAKVVAPVTSSHYSMQFSTYLIVLTLMGLVGVWWYTHSSLSPTSAVVAENSALLTDNSQFLGIQPASSLNAESWAAPAFAEVEIPKAPPELGPIEAATPPIPAPAVKKAAPATAEQEAEEDSENETAADEPLND